jgi:hypothetical protein
VKLWAQWERPFLHAQHFSLAPLQPLVRLEVLYALQQRDLEGLLLNPALVRRLIKELETESSARHMSTVPDGKLPKSSKQFHSLGRGVHRVLTGAYNQMHGIEVVPDPLAARGYDGEGVSQAWLKMLITDWERRTKPTPDRLREAIKATHVASQALEKHRRGGHDYTILAFDDMDSIVKAIGFQCAGCGFYRPDASYLTAIDEHILSLKATREKAVAMEADDFVVRNLNDQINAFNRVRTKMRDQLEDMDADERQQIEEASTVLRKSRASQGLATRLTITPIEPPRND